MTFDGEVGIIVAIDTNTNTNLPYAIQLNVHENLAKSGFLFYWAKEISSGRIVLGTFSEDEHQHIVWRREDSLSLVKKYSLPQPHQSLLRSGDKIVCNNGFTRYILLETGTVHSENGDKTHYISDLSYHLPIDKIYRNNTLIAERTKSPTEIERERIQKEIELLQIQLSELR